jgi:hypothetical protein
VAQIGHGSAAGGDEEIGEGRCEGAAGSPWPLARIDGAPGHEPGERRSRRDPANLRLETQSLGHAQGLQLVPGLAVRDYPGDKADPVAQHSINEPVEFMKFVAT